eukprot:Lithocolla_globosa_v1_NODE_3751_length_1591_cov_7.676432.p4 type:complete len:103 gc:universal NODE_3751_length_1591_cov_7.676432:586-894(+)
MVDTALYSSLPGGTGKRCVESWPFWLDEAQKRRRLRGSNPRTLSLAWRASETNRLALAGKETAGWSVSRASINRGRQSFLSSDAGLWRSPTRFRTPPCDTVW